ncbi:hypothetical protein ABBQ38_006129 [Trebouxia sp. C0009 RCD-2024]
MGAKRAPSAYFVFANEQRSVTKDELLAAATDGKASSVADVAKSIGHKWRELDTAGQQQYKDKAAALAAEIAANHAEAEDDSGTQAEADQLHADNAEVPGLPLTSVKRIMCLDEDVARVSADAVKGMAKAAELFLEFLASKAVAQAKNHKRSTIKFCDMQQAILTDKRFNEMGLKHMFLTDALFADARTDGKENLAAPRKACKVGADDTPGSRPITDFFTA